MITAPPVPASFEAGGRELPGAGSGIFARPAAGPVGPAAGSTERPAAADFATPYRDLSTAALLGQRKNPPTSGWRKALYVASFKQVNVGESPKITHRNNLIGEVSQPLQGCYRIALMSLKGGVGQDHHHRDAGRHVRLDPRRSGDRGGCQPRSGHAEPEGAVGDGCDGAAPAAGRRRHRALQRRTGLHRHRGRAGWRCWPPRATRRCRRRSAPTTICARWRCWSGSTSLVLTDCGTGLMHSAMSAVLSEGRRAGR